MTTKTTPEPKAELRVKLPKSLHQRLTRTAADRDLGVTYLVSRALETYLARLDAQNDPSGFRVTPSEPVPIKDA